jgi:uncharacterized protein DUF1559
MSNTNETSTLGPATQVRELRDEELQKVSGGTCCAGSHFAAVKMSNVTDGTSNTLLIGG